VLAYPFFRRLTGDSRVDAYAGKSTGPGRKTDSPGAVTVWENLAMTNPAPPQRAVTMPDKPSVDGLEDKWMRVWAEQGTYTFDRSAALSMPRDRVFSIDTPPPTASGSLHVGHVFSYTHTDCLARYKRMAGFEVFYPIGWDDNGLPTERRVQNYYGVRGDATQPYIEDFVPPQQGDTGTSGKSLKLSHQQPLSRRNFIELCDLLTVQDEKTFESLFRRLGFSWDWDISYRTIDTHSRTVAQEGFLGNLARGEAYQAEAPGLWDVTFQTAVAQAELEARDYPGHFHRVAFHAPDGTTVHIETTRPELLPSVVALIAHPDDKRYAALFGTTVTSPLFGVEIPVVAHYLAEPDKGSGIAMCCTFGDLTDVQWWRELQLPTRSIIQPNGRIQEETPEWIPTEAGRTLFSTFAGKTTFGARTAVVEALRISGDLEGEPTPTQRKANYFEKGDKPLEIVTSRQWYIRNGGRDVELRSALIKRGKQIDFHPEFMRTRYENWVNGLNGDWLVSRQRFFGVAIPLWYPLDADGEPDHDHPIAADIDQLPVDPFVDVPAGYQPSQRGQAGGFIGDPDVMDTWATSSLTPQIAAGWHGDTELFEKIFPMDVRPQGQDIIRTWLFSTVLRAHLEHDSIPWRHAAISGWILDPDRKKMSKSKGNAQTPEDVVIQHGADAVRYWAASARLGTDAAYDTGQMKVGRRLAIKVLNATKFALSFGEVGGDLQTAVTHPLDQSMLAGLADVIIKATKGLDAYDHTRALEVTEAFFWTFCDDYLELVKERAYGGQGEQGAASARASLRIALDVLLRLLAPFLPYATEEVWSWWHDGSIHRAAWPTPDDLNAIAAQADPAVLGAVGVALAGVRRAKSEAKVGMRAEVRSAVLTGPPATLSRIRLAATDLNAAGRIAALDYQPGDTFTVHDVVLAPVEPKA
jgi:valyl-tRNA synthetase